MEITGGKVILPFKSRKLRLSLSEAHKLDRLLSLRNREVANILIDEWGMEVPIVVTESKIYFFLPDPNGETRIESTERLKFTLELAELLHVRKEGVEAVV